MKTRRMMTLIAFAIAAVLLAVPANAQTISLWADVPFDFSANNVALNSGRCTVQSIGQAIVLTDAQQKHVTTLLIAEDVRNANDAKMIFHRYGEQYVLVGIEMPNATYKLPASKREAQLARGESPEQVAVMASSFAPAR